MIVLQIENLHFLSAYCQKINNCQTTNDKKQKQLINAEKIDHHRRSESRLELVRKELTDKLLNCISFLTDNITDGRHHEAVELVRFI